MKTKSGYERRNRALKLLGFSSYAEYLASDLWATIREGMMKTNTCCKACGSVHFLQVHHTKYTINNLRGDRTRGMVVLCKKCHYSTEFTKSKKLTLPAAQRKFKHKMKSVAKRRQERDATCKILADGYKNGTLLPDRLPTFIQ